MKSWRHVSTLLFVIAGAGAIRVSYLAFSYVTHIGGVERRHVESASFIFAALLLATALPTLAIHEPQNARSDAGWRLGILVLAATALLFIPALSIGLLSDDFDLLRRASEWQLASGDWEYVRPVPLAVWGLLAKIAGGNVSVALHALNIVLHAVNAMLVYRIGWRVGLRPTAALIAAMLFAVFPTNVEAVVWAAGIFDVALTTMVLALAVIAIDWPDWSPQAALSVVVLSAAALGTKETAVALPFILIAAVAVAPASRATRGIAGRYWVALIASTCVVVYVLGRVASSPPNAAWPQSGYQWKELLTRPVGTLALPLHVDSLRSWPLVSGAVTACVPIVLLAGAYRWSANTSSARLAIALTLWVYAAVAPLVAMFYVGPDLQGSRYVYLSSAAWAILFASADGQRLPARVHVAVRAMLVGMMLWYGVATQSSFARWQQAATLRDAFLANARLAASGCVTQTLNVPDHHDGAFVFRNGVEEALQMEGIRSVRNGSMVTITAACGRPLENR